MAVVLAGCGQISTRRDAKPRRIEVKKVFESPPDFFIGGIAKGKDGTIYVGSDDLCAFTPDGTLKWRFKIGTLSVKKPLIGEDGLIYVTGNDIFGLTPQGEKKIAFTPKGGSGEVSIAKDGTVYCAGTYGYVDTLFAYRPDGIEKWHFKVNGFLHTSPTLGADGTIYVTSNHGLQAIAPDGVVKWEIVLTKDNLADFGKPAVAADGTIYVSGDFTLYAFEPSGKKKWDKKWCGDVVIGKDGTLYASSQEGLVALTPAGKKKWALRVDGIINDPSLGDDGTIYFWSENSGEELPFLGRADNRLFAISPDGKEKWNIETYAFDPPLTGPDGTLFLVDNAGRLCIVTPR